MSTPATDATPAAASAPGGAAAPSAPSVDEWASLRPLLTRASPFVNPNTFDPEDGIDTVQNSTRVLVVGAGGLGCEILKNLALSGFTDIHVIDLDTVDVSNLNRQFLFRKTDVDKPKAEVAARFIRTRCPGVNVTAHTKPIQEFGAKWYAQFDLVIAGLDNVEARQWLNATLVSLVRYDDEGKIDTDTVIPLIDGGTEGFNGQARVFLPRITSCFECSLASMPPQTGFAVCTIRNVPRLPEHCVVYALKVEWPLLTSFTSVTDFVMSERAAAGAAGAGDDDDMEGAASVRLDKDNVEHMSWLYNRALQRAERFGIKGVTYNLTMQVVKGIIPAIASTNALISAACVSEALKYRTGCGPTLNNYYMYIGGSGVNSETIAYARNPQCAVCQPPLIQRGVDPAQTLGQWLSALQAERRLAQPSVSLGGQFLYLASLHAQHKDNLDKCLGELLESGSQLVVNDKSGQTVKALLYFAA